MNLVFTGRATDENGQFVQRRELVEACAELGWRVDDVVSSVTTTLVAGADELIHPTKKVRDARRAGISVQSYEWLHRHLAAERRSRADYARAQARDSVRPLDRRHLVGAASREQMERDTRRLREANERRPERPTEPVRQVSHITFDTVREVLDPDTGQRLVALNQVRRRIVEEPWLSWSGEAPGVTQMQFDWVSTWMDRLAVHVEWRFSTWQRTTAEFRLSYKAVQSDVLTWPELEAQIEQKRVLWLKKHEPPAFPKRGPRKLL